MTPPSPATSPIGFPLTEPSARATAHLRGWLDGRGGVTCRGKSGLHMKWCRVTPGGGNPRDSATENEVALHARSK